MGDALRQQWSLERSDLTAAATYGGKRSGEVSDTVHQPKRCRRVYLGPSACAGGFTLVELLAVIAILVLLLSLLAPTLKQAKFLAKKAVCAANLRSLHASMAAYNLDWHSMPPACQGMNVNAFGDGSTTAGFGLLTWNGYCETQEMLACAGAHYIPSADVRIAGTPGGPPNWGYFCTPRWFPMKGKCTFLYGDKNGSSNYKGYGNASSYSYRRASRRSPWYAASQYISAQKAPLDEKFPNAYIACSQQVQGDFDHWTFMWNDNYCHQKAGSNVLWKDGHAEWFGMTDKYLPYNWPGDYPYQDPPSEFWGSLPGGN